MGRNRNDDSGISSTVGVMLMLILTVLMSMVVATMVFGIQPPPMSPLSAITVEPNLATSGIMDIKITHMGGASLTAGDWWLSIVPSGNSPAFIKSDRNISVGDQLVSRITTDGTGTYNMTNGVIQTTGTATPIVANGRYHVQIKYEPLKSISMDDTVTVR